MARLTLTFLGPMEVTLDGKRVTGFASNKVRALLAYLAVEADRPHHREALIGMLWPDYPERAARASLRNALANLRQALGDHSAQPPFLHITRETIQFNSDSDCWTDVAAFRASVDARGAAKPARQRLEEASRLYRGGFLEGFCLNDSAAFDDWCRTTQEHLERLAVAALHLLAQECEQRGEFDRGCTFARREVDLEPWQEEAHCELMRLLALSGQRSAALTQYKACRRALMEELGVEPSVETTLLYERIRDGAIQVQRIASTTPHNLPGSLTPFVGREAELAGINERLQDSTCRLLTLVGAGGSGKTRLALEAAAAQLDHYPHGVYFVSLAPLDSAEAIVPTVAMALGFSFYAEAGVLAQDGPRRQVPARQQLLDYLRPKTMLLILDNFEHLLEGVGLVTDILRAAPGVRILATSRARLNVGGEHRFRIAGMDYPDDASTDGRSETCAQLREEIAQYGAVKLFLQGARRARPGFELTAENLNGVVQVCRLVDGLPLGIRLAASWVEMLSPAEIAVEIGRSLDFLETERSDAPARQRSMRAAFDHSYHLLSEQEQRVFQRLSVFRGGFTQDAAQRVAGGSLRELRALVDKSLLERDSDGRYDSHELLRQYAAEKLTLDPSAWEAVHRAHTALYAAALEQWAEDLRGPRQQTALSEMDVEIENARAAWDWAVKRVDVERLEQAIEGLCLFYEWRGRYQDGEAACQAAAEKLRVTAADAGFGLEPSTMPGASVAKRTARRLRVLARALAWQSAFNLGLGHVELASQLIRQSLECLAHPELTDEDTRAERAIALKHLGEIARESDYEEARRLFERSLVLYRSLGDPWGTSRALKDLGETIATLGRYDAAKQLYEESLAISQALGDRRALAESLRRLAEMVGRQGQPYEGERLARKSIAVCREIGDWVGLAEGLTFLGSMLAYLGSFAEACPLFEESAAISNDLGMRANIAWANNLLGWLKTNLGLYEEAHDLKQTTLDLFLEIGSQPGIAESLLGLSHLALVREAYAEAQNLSERSAAIFQEAGIRDERNLVLTCVGHAALGLDQLAQARRYLFEALEGSAEAGTLAPAIFSIALLALLLARQGEVERAVELYALASRYPYVGNSRYWEDVVGRHIATAAATLPPEVAAAAQERGKERDLNATVAELMLQSTA